MFTLSLLKFQVSIRVQIEIKTRIRVSGLVETFRVRERSGGWII